MRSLMIACLALLILAFGCGKAAEKAQEAAIEQAVKAGNKDAAVDVDVKSGSFSMTATEQGKTTTINVSEEGGTMVTSDGGKFSMTTGKGAKLPDNFSKDMPMYAGAELQSVMSNEGEGAYMVESTTSDAMETVGKWYRDQLVKAGWTEDQFATMGGESPMQMMAYTKENRQIAVTLAVNDGVTRIVCTLNEEK